MSISRRTLVRYGVGGALVLAAGGTGLALQRTTSRAPSRPLRALDSRSFSILVAVADRIIPVGGGFPAASELQVAEAIDELLARSHPAVAAEVSQVLALLENGLAGLLFDGRPRTFTSLEPAEQDAALQAWQGSSLAIRRTAYKALHGLCAAVYYASPSIDGLVGYPGPPDYGNLAAPAPRVESAGP